MDDVTYIIVTSYFLTNVEPVDEAVPLNSEVLVKFHWVQVELLDHRLVLMLAFYLFIYLSSRGVESSSSFYTWKSKLLAHTFSKHRIFYSFFQTCLEKFTK